MAGIRVLGLDSATSGCSAALWTGGLGPDGRPQGGLVAHRREAMARGQAERLVAMAVEVLAEAGWAFAEIDRVAVTVGPGAFTGLRIALAAARGFALALDRPLIGVTTFEAVAHGLDLQARRGRRLLVAIESRRAEPYLQLFDEALVALGSPALLAPAAVAAWLGDGPTLIAGDAAHVLMSALAGRPETFLADPAGFPDAGVVAARGAALALAGSAGLPAEPLYLRPPDVSLPATKGPVAKGTTKERAKGSANETIKAGRLEP